MMKRSRWKYRSCRCGAPTNPNRRARVLGEVVANLLAAAGGLATFGRLAQAAIGSRDLPCDNAYPDRGAYVPLRDEKAYIPRVYIQRPTWNHYERHSSSSPR